MADVMEARHRSCILLRVHLHPKGMAAFSTGHCLITARLRERQDGPGHQHSQRWITSVHSPQGLACLLTQLCTHMLAKKEKNVQKTSTSTVFSSYYLCLELRFVPGK